MRKWIVVLCAIGLLSAVSARGQQSLNVDLSGRWAKGRCEALARRVDFTFIGNGRYIEVYRNRRGIYTRMDDLLLPGPVEDIWVKSDLRLIYVACGEAGVRIIQFNSTTSTFDGIIGSYDTPGYAHGIMQFGITAYVADGPRGLFILDIEDPYVPKAAGTYSTSGFAQRVWVVNDSTVLVAADLAGLYSVKTKNPAQPVFLDSLVFSSAFPGFNIPSPRAYSVIAVDTVAYVADGYGGLRTVHIKNPSRLSSLGKWTSGLPIDVRGLWITGTTAHLACGADGFFSPINIANPRTPSGPTFLPVQTGGFTTAVIVQQDTAFLADGSGGHVLVNAQSGFQPFLTDSIQTGDYTYDALISGNYALVANGKDGIKTLDLNQLNPERMEEVASYSMPGEARALKKVGSQLFVADGSHGLTILNASDPLQLSFINEYVTGGDSCYDVDVSGSYAFLACGRDGLRVVDVSGSVFEVPGSPFNTRGKALSVQIVKNKAYVADSTGVYVYDISQLSPQSSTMTLVDSLSAAGFTLQAVGLDVTVTGDSVFVANGTGGFLMWNRTNQTVMRITTTGRANDLVIRDKTLFVANGEGGLRIFDFSEPGTFNEVGYYNTDGRTLKIAVAAAGGKICAADGDGGLFVLQSSIFPRIELVPYPNLNFGLVPPDFKRTRVLWVINKGTTLLKVTDIRCLSTTFKFARTSFTVAPQDTFSLSVRYEPKMSSPMLETPTTVFYSNDPNTPTVSMTLQGEMTAHVVEGPYIADLMTVGLYHFDEANGAATVTDASGNSFHGIVHNNPLRQDSDRSGWGRQIFFDKQNDWIGIPFNQAFNFYNNPFTVELWFNMATKPENPYLLMRRGNGSTRQYELALVSGTQGLIGSVWDANGIQHTLSAGSMDAFRTGQWYHTAMTFDGDTLRLYLNGVLKNKEGLRKRLRFEATEPLVVGASTFAEIPFHGAIDEVRISNIAREPWEFHVNRSRLDLDAPQLDFGKVLTGYSRRLPLKITNGGAQVLVISSMSTTNNHVTLSSFSAFTLDVGQSKTIYATFKPVSEEVFGQGSQLQIVSSDPTYPTFNLPLYGSGITQIPAGSYKTDAFTIGLWHFNEASGTTAFDSSGYGMNGALLNGAYFDSQKMKFVRSAHFDGINDLCRMIPPQGLVVGPRWGGMTIEGWFMLERIPTGKQIFLRRGKDTGLQFELYADSTSAIVGKMVNTQGQAFSVTSKALGNILGGIWYHAAMVLDSSSLSLYINGNKTDSRTFSGQLVGAVSATATDTLSLLAGRDWEAQRRLLGNLDEIRISNAARQPWEFNVNLARIVVSDSMQFGSVPVGRERMRKLWVKNTGIDKLFVDEIVQTSPTIFKLDTLKFTVNPGDSQLVKVTFKPLSAVKQTARITFRTNDPFYPNKVVTLYGAGVASIPPDPYATDPFTVVLFHMNEKPDTVKTVADSSGNRLNGSLGGIFTRIDSLSGRFNRAIQFAGGRIKVPTNAKLNLRYPEWTVEFWFQMIEKPAKRVILYKSGNLDTSQVEMSLEPAGFAAKIWNAQGVADTLQGGSLASLNLYQWYHAALSWDGDSLKLYLNAKIKRIKAFRGPLRHAVKPALCIGADENSTAPFKGQMDEFRLSRIARKDWEFDVKQPTIEISPTELNFANVLVDQSRTQNFWVKNIGDQDLRVSNITVAVAQFIIPDSLKSFSLFRMMNKMISVTYTPKALGNNAGVLAVVSNDPTRPSVQVQLSGSGAELKPPGPYPLDAHTVSLYHLDQIRQDSVLDASAKRRHGLLKYDVLLTSNGFFGSGLVFDGSDGRVEVPSDTAISFDYRSKSFTVECYFKTDTADQALLFKGFADSLHAVDFGLLIDSDGRLSVNGLPGTGPRFSDGSWHHAAFTYNHFTKTGKLYADGNQLWSRIMPIPAASKLHDRPLLFGSAERQLKSYHRFLKGTLDEIRISDIARESWEFQFIDLGIRTNSVKPDPPESGKQAVLQFNVPSSLQATKVEFYFRSGGGTAYSFIDAVKLNSSTYNATLPGESVTLEGLEYYLKVTTSKNTYTYPLIDATENPKSVPVRHSGMSAPLSLLNRQFQMISVPFQLDTTKVEGVLGDDFGSYDPHYWRLFAWHYADTTYASFTDTTLYIPHSLYNLFDFFPGRAYWITTYLDRTFDVGRGQTVTTDSGFVFSLHPGWNMIADPFNFEVKWDDCSLSSDSLGTLYYYKSEDGYHPDYPLLEPWKGYWIYNAAVSNESLIVLPRKRETLVPKTVPQHRLASSFGKGEWMLKISAEVDKIKDGDNYAGVRNLASDTWDPCDRPDPPPVDSSSICLSFDNSHWDRHAGTYAADIRPAGGQGHAWDFFVETWYEEKTAVLNWNCLSSLPEGWEAYLFDLEEGNSTNAIKVNSKTYQTGGAVPNVRRFRLVAGTPEFIRAQSEGISLEPVEFHLYQNYPNPFNPQTTIYYALPKNGETEITIFNALGQKVRSLLKQNEKSGRHEVVWDGRNDSGLPASSGIYVLRLKTPDHTAVRKMTVLK